MSARPIASRERALKPPMRCRDVVVTNPERSPRGISLRVPLARYGFNVGVTGHGPIVSPWARWALMALPWHGNDRVFRPMWQIVQCGGGSAIAAVENQKANPRVAKVMRLNSVEGVDVRAATERRFFIGV